MTDLHNLSRRDLAAIINGFEPGDIAGAKEELKRREVHLERVLTRAEKSLAIARIQFVSAGATRKR